MVLNESTIPDLLSGPVNIKWEEGVPVPFTTRGHSTVLCNGAIYVGGGACSDFIDYHKVYIYHPDTNKWDDAIDIPYAFYHDCPS